MTRALREILGIPTHKLSAMFPPRSKTTRARVAAALTALPGLIPLRTQNPDFPGTRKEVALELKRMRDTPRPLERPVVVLSGWRSPSLVSLAVAERLRAITSGSETDFFPLAYPMHGRIPDVAQTVARAVASRFPGASDRETAPIDIVAHSMGGLVARAGATGALDGMPRLNIARLFTLGTPHRGAKLARLLAPDLASHSMRPGSAFLKWLDEHSTRTGYELVCYAHLNDRWVGATNCAPPWCEPIWTAGTAVFSHFSVTEDRRILADIARRLRGEAPLARAASKPPRD